jgi:hypothetical protein
MLIGCVLLAGPAGANHPPQINAGPDQVVGPNETVRLSAVVTDPEPPYVTIGWSKVSGPGNVEFSAQRSAMTEATFSEPGEYELMLGGYDGHVVYDFVSVTVTR